MTRGFRLDTLKARRLLAGWSITDLARQAACSDQTIQQLENGGNCDPDVATRILNALAPAGSITSNSQQNPTVITASAAHQLQTGDTVVIAGNASSNAEINGSRVVTRINATTFSVPVNCTTAGGTGGTFTPTSACVGASAL